MLFFVFLEVPKPMKDVAQVSTLQLDYRLAQERVYQVICDQIYANMFFQPFGISRVQEKKSICESIPTLSTLEQMRKFFL